MQSTTLGEALRAVEIFEQKHRRDDAPSLTVGGVYDLYPKKEQVTPVEVVEKWPNSIPLSGKAGVYLIFADDLTLLYVGKSSANQYIGTRQVNYWGYDSNKDCEIRGAWIRDPRYVVNIAVPDDMRFEASALEEYLIYNLHPLENKVGRQH